MNCSINNDCVLAKKIKELEEKINHLRISRRVLLSLIEKIHQEKKAQLDELESKNLRLKRKNLKLAKRMLTPKNHLNLVLISDHQACGCKNEK